MECWACPSCDKRDRGAVPAVPGGTGAAHQGAHEAWRACTARAPIVPCSAPLTTNTNNAPWKRMTTLAQVPDMQVIRQGCGTYTYEVLLNSAIVKSCSHNISGVWGAMEARCTTVLNRCLRFVCIISFARARLFLTHRYRSCVLSWSRQSQRLRREGTRAARPTRLSWSSCAGSWMKLCATKNALNSGCWRCSTLLSEFARLPERSL